MSSGGRGRGEIFFGTRAVTIPTGEIELDVLRRTFSDLLDEACDAVTKCRLDLDVVTVERSLVCVGPGGINFFVTSPPLADCDRLRAAIREAGEISSAEDPPELSILEARVRVFHEVTEIPL
ncbi:MAG: hypothetical protein HY287_15205 [Planctomycetes bacterium]|nr:hypothetical protein [Planctomycetota bacterium]MBI3835672.1 hypothetical protein [Planctomycetota bacterium]